MSSTLPLAFQQMLEASQEVAAKRAAAGLKGYGSFGYFGADAVQPTDAATCTSENGTWDSVGLTCSGATASVAATATTAMTLASTSPTPAPAAVPAATVMPTLPTYSAALLALQAQIGPIGAPTLLPGGARVLSTAQQAQFLAAVNAVGATVITASPSATGVSDVVTFENIPSSPTISASTWIGWRLAEGKSVVLSMDPTTATMGLVAGSSRAAQDISAATSNTIVATPASISPAVLALVGVGAVAAGFFGWRYIAKRRAA